MLPFLSLLLVGAIILGEHWIHSTVLDSKLTAINNFHFASDICNDVKVTIHLRAQIVEEPSKSSDDSGMSDTTKSYLYSPKGVDWLTKHESWIDHDCD